MAIIESVSVIRPLKLIAFTCLLISILLLVISLSTTTWLRAGHFKTGLFEECTSSKAMGTRELPPMAPRPGSCHSSSVRGKELEVESIGNRKESAGGQYPQPPRAFFGCGFAYIKATAVLLIIGTILIILALFATGFGLATSRANRKYRAYRVAVYLTLVAAILKFVALIVFPVCFYSEIKEWAVPSWDFDWSYGVAWGSVLFTAGACILLLCDKEQEEIYYKEKTIYTAASTT